MAETIIDIPSRGGLRGRLDRMFEDHTMKAQALGITLKLLDEDDRRAALETAPKKFLDAITHRATNGNGNGNGHHAPAPNPNRVPVAERLQQIRDVLTEHDGMTTQEIADAIHYKSTNSVLKIAFRVAKSKRDGKEFRWYLKAGKQAKPAKAAKPAKVAKAKKKKTPSGLSGKPKSLFLLEHLDESSPTTISHLALELERIGSPIGTLRDLNGPMNAALVKHGYAKKNGDGFIRTAKGSVYMQEMRQGLEAKNLVAPGGWSV